MGLFGTKDLLYRDLWILSCQRLSQESGSPGSGRFARCEATFKEAHDGEDRQFLLPGGPHGGRERRDYTGHGGFPLDDPGLSSPEQGGEVHIQREAGGERLASYEVRVIHVLHEFTGGFGKARVRCPA